MPLPQRKGNGRSNSSPRVEVIRGDGAGAAEGFHDLDITV